MSTIVPHSLLSPAQRVCGDPRATQGEGQGITGHTGKPRGLGFCQFLGEAGEPGLTTEEPAGCSSNGRTQIRRGGDRWGFNPRRTPHPRLVQSARCWLVRRQGRKRGKTWYLKHSASVSMAPASDVQRKEDSGAGDRPRPPWLTQRTAGAVNCHEGRSSQDG